MSRLASRAARPDAVGMEIDREIELELERALPEIDRPRRRVARTIGLVVLAVLLLIPVYRWNALGSADQAQFDGWQLDSQALVTAKIESTTPQAKAPGIDALGLLYANPEMLAPNATFDWLSKGAVPTTTNYGPYQSQIGLPGYLFTGLYHLGFTTISSLQIVSSALFVGTLLWFAFLLARITRPSFAVVFLVVAIGSPWLTVAGRNLYWVPWTWFLPACAAILVVTNRGRRRWLALLLLAAAFMVKWASGYEYLTSVTLLAAATPVLAAVFTRRAAPRAKTVALEAGLIVLVGFVCFVVSIIALAFLAGAGDFGYGMQIILQDAGKRTYGGVATDNPLIAESLAASPVNVVAAYLFGWTTNVLTLGSGAPLALAFGPRTFWFLVLAAVAVVVIRALRKDSTWWRDAWIVLIAMAVPISWFVAAKGHSYLHSFINFVLFYLITVGALIWVIGAALVPLVRAAVVDGTRSVLTRAKAHG